MGPTIEATHVRARRSLLDRRVVLITGVAVLVAVAASGVAQLLTRLISFVTNVAFFGRPSLAPASPADHHLGPMVMIVPVVGGLIVGVMARYGSKAIRGHGIPEAMEQVLTNESRIPARLTFLKPLSAAISIGTGGPFGAEGPIIATGGALGSLMGQLGKTTAAERKILLAAGAAAGMSATFGTPVSAVLLAIELLLFEYRARSLIPVALASGAASAARIVLVGADPVFAMPNLAQPGGVALTGYVVIGGLVGLASIGATRIVYWIEDAFEKLPIHWMWWPALGAIAVGVVGWFDPRTLGVGYENIDQILSARITGVAVLTLCSLKFVSWSIALGSGTSGGTLAPLLTVGGGLGAILATGSAAIVPRLGLDPRIAALVGMAAMFAGASRALLASVVFAFEATRQPLSLLPLLGGCAMAHLVSLLWMRHSIMTEKIARRGVRAVGEYAVDPLDRVNVRQVGLRDLVTLRAGDSLVDVRAWLATHGPGTSHQGFPVVDDGGLVGVLTRRDLLDAEAPADSHLRDLVKRAPVTVTGDSSVREATERMIRAGVGRLPVLATDGTGKLVGIITRSDVLAAYRHRIDEDAVLHRTLRVPGLSPPSSRAPGVSRA